MKNNPYYCIRNKIITSDVAQSFGLKETEAERELECTLRAFNSLSKTRKFSPISWKILEKMLDPHGFCPPCVLPEHTFMAWFLSATLKKQGKVPTSQGVTIKELYPFYERASSFFGEKTEKVGDFAIFSEKYMPLFCGFELVKINGSRSPKKQLIRGAEVDPNSPFIID